MNLLYEFAPWAFHIFDEHELSAFKNNGDLKGVFERLGATTVAEASEKLIDLNCSHCKLDRAEYLAQAARRVQYAKKAAFFFNKSPGFPIDEEKLRAIYRPENAHKVQQLVCDAANEVAPLFFHNGDCFEMDRVARDTLLADLDLNHISELKHLENYRPIYTAYRTLQAFNGKAATLPAQLVNGHLRGGYRPMMQKLGRTSPKPGEGFIMNQEPWMRHLIKPKPGKVFIKADWVAQEQWIAVAMTGDTKLQAAYQTGDIYTAVGKEMRVIPLGGDKHTHPTERSNAKRLQLGISYGQGKTSLGRVIENGESLYDVHRGTFTTFWDTTAQIATEAIERGAYIGLDGWIYLVHQNGKDAHKLKNAPFQIEGAAMLREAVLQLDPKIDLIGTLHDAMFVSCANHREIIEETKYKIKAAMDTAAKLLFGTMDAPFVDFEVYTDYYEDSRGTEMFKRVCSTIDMTALPERRKPFITSRSKFSLKKYIRQQTFTKDH